MAHCEWPGTAALLHGDLKIKLPLAPRQLLCKIAAATWLPTPPTIVFSMTTNHGLRTPLFLPSAMATMTPSPYPIVLPSCMVDRSAATMLRALVFSCSTTASRPLTLGTTWSTRMSSRRYSRRLGSVPQKGASSQPCNICPVYLDFPLFYPNKLVSPPSQEPGIYTRFCPFYFSSNSPGPHPPRPPTSTTLRRCITMISAWLSAVACSLATAMVHVVRTCLKLYHIPCPQVVVIPSSSKWPTYPCNLCCPGHCPRTPHFVLLRVLWGAAPLQYLALD